MPEPPAMEWAGIPAAELNIPLTLTSGQSFGWHELENGRWIGAVGETGVLLEPEEDGFRWATWPEGRWDVIQRYLALDVGIEGLYRTWTAADASFALLIERFRGLRVLRQSADTVLCAFVCSSCNNVPRISRMIRALARMTGRRILAPWSADLYAEPSLRHVGNLGEDVLREAGFGYRARYLAQLGARIAAQGTDSLSEMAFLRWDEARTRLLALPGVGPKVADCVGLFGLGHDHVIPVDRHVRRYVVSRHRPDLAGKSLTTNVYTALASAFRGIMGPYAGWAQQYVFMAARTRRDSDS